MSRRVATIVEMANNQTSSEQCEKFVLTKGTTNSTVSSDENLHEQIKQMQNIKLLQISGSDVAEIANDMNEVASTAETFTCRPADNEFIQFVILDEANERSLIDENIELSNNYVNNNSDIVIVFENELQNEVATSFQENDNVSVSVKSSVNILDVNEGLLNKQVSPVDNRCTNNLPLNISNDNELNIVGNKGKRKRKELTKSALNKLKKQKGESYVSKTNKVMREKSIKVDPCSHGKCQNNCTINMGSEREKIFKMFYELDNTAKKGFLLSCIKETDKKRLYSKCEISRRKRSMVYFLPKNGEQIVVCQQFLLNTLNISQRTLQYTFDNRTDLLTPKYDMRGKHEPPNKTSAEKLQVVENFIKSLPAVPSHYVRKHTTRLYLPIEFKNLSNLYRIYINHCKTSNYTPVKKQVFLDVFRKDFNIAIHHPKKDKCVKCEKFKNNGDEEDVDYQKHITEKAFAEKAYEEDRARGKCDSSFLCTSFDLQKVLNTPMGKRNMLFYYSRKYSMYNFTLYESNTRDGFCYMWGESDGARGANEVSSILYQYLNKVDERKTVTDVVLYCDSCPGQQKNRQVWVMLFYFLKSSKVIRSIRINYLIPGHTYMPVDSMHACIESNYRDKTIWAPSEWPTIVTNSRISPRQYNVEVLNHKTFRNWKEIQQSVLPDTKTKSEEGVCIKIKDVCKVAFYKETNTAEIYCSFNASTTPIHLMFSEKKRRSGDLQPKVLYSSQLPISVKKYKDLNNLCKKGIIPSRYHGEYERLPKRNDIPDVLNETDEEDVDED